MEISFGSERLTYMLAPQLWQDKVHFGKLNGIEIRIFARGDAVSRK